MGDETFSSFCLIELLRNYWDGFLHLKPMSVHLALLQYRNQVLPVNHNTVEAAVHSQYRYKSPSWEKIKEQN